MGHWADAFAARSIKRATSSGLEMYTAWLAGTSIVSVSLVGAASSLLNDVRNRARLREEDRVAVRLNPKSKDVVIGHNDPADSIFDVRQTSGAPLKITGFSHFVTTQAVAYCFLPSVTALKFIANLNLRRRTAPHSPAAALGDTAVPAAAGRGVDHTENAHPMRNSVEIAERMFEMAGMDRAVSFAASQPCSIVRPNRSQRYHVTRCRT
jgi:hypothetical protein